MRREVAHRQFQECTRAGPATIQLAVLICSADSRPTGSSWRARSMISLRVAPGGRSNAKWEPMPLPLVATRWPVWCVITICLRDGRPSSRRGQTVDTSAHEGDQTSLPEAYPDDAALWEIDENFARAELTDAQRADHHKRRKELLERRGEARTRGGDRKSNSQVGSLKGYAQQAAETLGVGVSSVHRDLRRATMIDGEVLSEVAGTALDKGVVLDELARNRGTG